MSRTKRHLLLTLLSALVLALSSMTAVFAGGPSDRAGTAQAGAQDDGGDHCEDSDNKGHKDCKPQNNPKPDNPPCDADHGHPGNNSPRCQDRDGDGVPDDEDKCPDEPGPPENDGCPPPCPDQDNDGVCDDDDQCPDEAGTPENDGCPPPCPDQDNDGVCDDDDQCPDEAGTPENDGCPPPCPDQDNDGVCDDDDQCPDEAGTPENNGCPEEPAACPEGALIDHEIDGVVYACVILLPAEDESAVCPPGTIGPIATGENPLVEACVILGPTGDEEGNATAAAVSQRLSTVALLRG